MGYAQLYDGSSQHVVAPALPIASVATVKTSVILDRMADNGQPLTEVQVLALITAVTAAGSADGTLVTTVTVQHGEDAGLSDASTFKTYIDSKIVGVNNGTHNLSVAVPVKLEKAKRYIRFTVLQAKTGTVTLSSATGGAMFVRYPMNTRPDPAYSQDGYGAIVSP